MSTLSHVSSVEQYHKYREATDEALITSLKRLDVFAFDELVHRYMNRLCGFASYLIKDRSEEPEAVANMALWRLWNASVNGRLNDLTTSKHLLSLLLLTVKHEVFRIFKKKNCPKRGGKTKTLRIDRYLNIIADCSASVTDSAQGREFLKLIYARSKEYPSERLAEIFVLKIQGYTLNEISDRVGVSRTTVFSRVQQIKLLIKRKTKLTPVQ